MNNAVLTELHQKLKTTGLDSIGVIEVLRFMLPHGEVRAALRELLDNRSDIDLPQNVWLPLESILNQSGLLEGVLRLIHNSYTGSLAYSY
jgi:hypothetical protein